MRKGYIDLDYDVLQTLWGYTLFKSLLFGIAVMMVWILISTSIVSGVLSAHSVPDPYGVDKHGKVLQMTPLNEAHLRNKAVADLVEEFLEDTFTFDSLNYKDQLNKSGQLYFTPTGFKNFSKAMQVKDGFLEVVLVNHAIATAMSTGSPTLVGSKILRGRYAWKMLARLAVDFKGPSIHETRYFNISVVLTKQAVSEYEYGLAIESINL